MSQLPKHSDVIKRSVDAMERESTDLAIYYKEVADFLEAGGGDRLISTIAIVRHLIDNDSYVHGMFHSCPPLSALERKPH